MYSGLACATNATLWLSSFSVAANTIPTLPLLSDTNTLWTKSSGCGGAKYNSFHSPSSYLSIIFLPMPCKLRFFRLIRSASCAKYTFIQSNTSWFLIVATGTEASSLRLENNLISPLLLITYFSLLPVTIALIEASSVVTALPSPAAKILLLAPRNFLLLSSAHFIKVA